MALPVTEHGYSLTDPTVQSWLSLGLDEAESNPDLRWPKSIPVWDRMRTEDSQVISVLAAVTLPIRGTTWRIDPAGASDEVTQHVAVNMGLDIVGSTDGIRPLRTRGRFSWEEHLRHALLCLVFGHSFFEQIYRIDENGRTHLRKLGWRPPRTIDRIDVAPDGGLVAIRQKAPFGGKNAPRIGIERLVAYIHDREGGNWLGRSLLRGAYKPWLLKDRMLRVQAMTVDRNGLGVPVYTSSKPADGMTTAEWKAYQQEEIANGLALARGLRSGENTGAALPHGATLEFKGVSGHLPDADKPIRYYDEQIARSVLAHFLNLGTETGSWALGSTFADFFTTSLRAVTKHVADVTNQHVIEDLVDVAFGEDVPAPRLVYDDLDSGAPVTAEAIKALIDCGALTPDADLEAYLRDHMSLPAAKALGEEMFGLDGDAETARSAAEVAQKVYLAVQNDVLSRDEGRELIRMAGANLNEGDS